MATANQQTEWINATESCAMLGGIDFRAFRKLVARGLITERRLPIQARFLRSDVERVAEGCLRPATAAS